MGDHRAHGHGPREIAPTPRRSWTMALTPQSFPDRTPIGDEERALLLEYVTDCAGSGAYWRGRRVMARLDRLERPFGCLVTFIRREFSPNTCASGIPVFRRLLYRQMAETRAPFWLWEPTSWHAVQASMDTAAARERDIEHWVGTAAYLFAGVLPVARRAVHSHSVADKVFGSALVTAEADAVLDAIRPADAGWSARHKVDSPFRWFFALAMLVNGSPYLETYGEEALRRLASLKEHGFPARFTSLLAQFQSFLCAVGTLEGPIIDTGRRDWPLRALDRDLPDIDPAWVAWVRAYYDQTPGKHTGRTRRDQIAGHALMAGRWVRRFHPEVREPRQWDERLAQEYVAYTCQALCGELWAPEDRAQTRWKRARDKHLTDAAIAGRLGALRVFFRALQRNVYVVDGLARPKLAITWVPATALATPDNVKAGLQPNPRDVAADVWFKLVWAAATLTADDLTERSDPDAPRAPGHHPFFPPAYYRAAALLWVTGARRSDEIRRVTTGSVQTDIAPAMTDEHGNQIESEERLCYLRVPANKYGGEFYAPIPAYTAEAIQVWETLRPMNQRTWEDRKTRKQVGYLFSVRDRMMGGNFLNRHLIPLLCRKAGVPEEDAVGRITSHRSRATNAQWLRDMGLSPSDIGRILGHKHPETTLPWYLRESRHRLGRAFRRANPLDRQVAALMDPQAMKRGEPCVFYYLTDGPDGRPRLCGNPDFGACVHQMKCVECETFIDAEKAEIIEKRPGVLTIQVAVPLPEHVVQALEAEDGGDTAVVERMPPPHCPGPAFHFNENAPLRTDDGQPDELAHLHARLTTLSAQVERKRGKVDGRNAVLRSLMKEVADVKARIARCTPPTKS